MTRLVKIVDNKYVQIEEYRNPNICFDTNKYSDFENYCTLRETFDPFRMFYENQELQVQLLSNTLQLKELKKQLEEINKMIEKCGFVNIEQVMLNYCGLLTQQKEFIKYLEDEIENSTFLKPSLKMILQKYKKIIGDDK